MSGDKKIVVCTIQTFPFALEEVRKLSATDGKHFAVIADEAHSSQTGQAATKLKEVLSSEEQKELEDGGEVSTEDILAAQMAAKANDSGITYIAFTATPKAKTLETFGRLPDPTQPKSKENKPEPFHVYSMQQAIEEEFILDVLQNYTTYSLAFKLANHGKQWDEHEVEKGEAIKGLMKWVRLHPHNISQKVKIVVEHYRENVAHLLAGKAKAMVVTGSRQEAVRWQIAINKYIAECNYPLKTLVAFSGEVIDKDSGPDPFKETSHSLNPDLKGEDIRRAFKRPEYQILLVANKFQTGFDQPLLCAMYVDKKLAGIQAVQTLSRLNRCHEEDGIKKDTTYVLDFINQADDVLAAFKTYFTTAQLEDVSDPNIVLDLRSKLDEAGFYEEHEIDRVVEIALNPNSKQKQLEAAITPVADRLLKQYSAAKLKYKEALSDQNEKPAEAAKSEMDTLILFRRDLSTYLRAYTFLSQIFDYQNTDFEKRSIFFKYLIRLLKFGRERDDVDLSEVVLTHHKLKKIGKKKMKLADTDYPELKPLTQAGTGSVHEDEKALLEEIIEKLNDIFGSDTSDGDQLSFAMTLRSRIQESEILRQQAKNNTELQFESSPDLDNELVTSIIEGRTIQQDLSDRALKSKEIRQQLKKLLLGPGKLYELLKGLA